MKTDFNILSIRPTKQEDLNEMVTLARADNHEIIMPTHTVRKGETMLGYLSIAAMPTVLVWMHTQRTQVRDSLGVLSFFEGMVAASGASGLILPVMEHSPYRPLIEKVGYVNAGNASFLIKKL